MKTLSNFLPLHRGLSEQSTSHMLQAIDINASPREIAKAYYESMPPHKVQDLIYELSRLMPFTTQECYPANNEQFLTHLSSQNALHYMEGAYQPPNMLNGAYNSEIYVDLAFQQHSSSSQTDGYDEYGEEYDEHEYDEYSSNYEEENNDDEEKGGTNEEEEMTEEPILNNKEDNFENQTVYGSIRCIGEQFAFVEVPEIEGDIFVNSVNYSHLPVQPTKGDFVKFKLIKSHTTTKDARNSGYRGECLRVLKRGEWTPYNINNSYAKMRHMSERE